MRDSVKDALDGLVLQVNAKIDPKDLRRIETAIAQTKASPDVGISARDLEEIKQKLRRAEWRTPVKPVLDDNAVAKIGRELDEMKAAIKARVDLDEVSRKHALEAIRKTEAEIDAKVDIKGQDIAEIKEKIANIKSEVKVDASLEKATQRKIREQLAKIDAKLKAEAELDDASRKKLQAELKKLGGDIEAHAHLSEASKRKLKHELDKLDGKATVNADLDDGKARFDLLRLTKKPYFVDIHARLAKASLAMVAAQVKALAGGNVFGNLKNSLNDLFTNLDTFAVKAAGAGTAILGLTSIAGAGLGTVAQFGVSLAHTLPALLAMPGILGAAAAGIGIFAAAMSDASTVLEDLGPSFEALQDSISTSFWGEAEGSVRSLITNGLEALTPAISDVASAMGSMTSAVASAAQDHIPGFQASLGYLAEAMDIGGDGAGAFTDALLTLGEVGAKYLPSIASWANDVAYSFQSWVQAKTASGEMDQAIQAAAKTFGTLKDIVFDLGGILGGVFKAMASGSAPIDSIATALDNANKAVNGPLWQGTLSTIFSAMGDAASHAFAGVGSLGQAFTSLAPTLSTILPLVGQIIETGLKGISAALQDPAFQGGLTAFFQGVLTAVQALAPAMPALGQAFGAVATVAGSLLAAIAPLVAQLVEGLAPVFQQLVPILVPVIEQLGAALLPVIQALIPVISEIIAQLAPIISEYLPQILPPIVALVQQLASALIPAIQLVGQVMQWLMPLVMASWNGIMSTVTGAIQVIKGIIETVLAVIKGDWSGAWNGIKTIGEGIWNIIKGQFGIFGNQIMSMASTAWHSVWNTINGVWNSITSTVSSAINGVRNLISSGWSYVTSITSSMWSGIVSTVSSWVNNMLNTVRNIPTSIKNVFSGAASWLWDAGVSIIKGLLDGISSMFSSVKNKLSSLTNMLPSWKGPAPVDKVLLTPAGEMIMQGLIKGLESQYGAVRSSLQGLTEDLSKPATIGLSANVQPLPARASTGRPNPAPESSGSFDKGSRSGATINITNNYPQAKPDSKTRDEVAEGLRLAAII
uniref:Minor tail protein n=1 Tax=Siphoviridae sp. ctvv53 TaxID=2826513 RepID=A0A8S5QKI5_9CAUD|nr:MAG TPA: Minor tail protein [Siphoviridae sp. ctvv53]